MFGHDDMKLMLTWVDDAQCHLLSAVALSLPDCYPHYLFLSAVSFVSCECNERSVSPVKPETSYVLVPEQDRVFRVLATARVLHPTEEIFVEERCTAYSG